MSVVDKYSEDYINYSMYWNEVCTRIRCVSELLCDVCIEAFGMESGQRTAKKCCDRDDEREQGALGGREW